MKKRKERIVEGDLLYILKDTPYVIPAEDFEYRFVYVPIELFKQYKALNPNHANLKPYNYNAIRVWGENADIPVDDLEEDVTLIMTSESNAPMMSAMFTKGLASDPDYMTQDEAEAVTYTTLGTFAYNNEIETFTEFSYFNNVTKLNEAQFNGCYNLSEIDIPAYVTEIGNGAFLDCASLTNIELPESVDKVGAQAFSMAHHNEPQRTVSFAKCVNEIDFDSMAFDGCEDTTIYCCDIEFTEQEYEDTGAQIPDTSVKIMTTESNAPVLSVCYNNNLCANADYMTLAEAKAATPIQLQNIFKNNTQIITFNEFAYFEQATAVQQDMFNGCSNLTEITLPENCHSIGIRGFRDCISLETIAELPLSFTSIGERAFRGTESLAYISFDENTTSVGVQAFSPQTTDHGWPKEVWFANAFEDINFSSQAFTNCSNTHIYCNGVELTTAQYNAVGAEDPNPVILTSAEHPAEMAAFYSKGIAANATYLRQKEAEQCDNATFGTFSSNGNIEDMRVLSYFTGLTAFPQQCFYQCRKLAYAAIPPNVNTLPYRCFSNTDVLNEIENLRQVTVLGQQCLDASGAAAILHLGYVNNLGQEAFAWDGGRQHDTYRFVYFDCDYSYITTIGSRPFANNRFTTIYFAGVEATDAQYTALGATKPVRPEPEPSPSFDETFDENNEINNCITGLLAMSSSDVYPAASLVNSYFQNTTYTMEYHTRDVENFGPGEDTLAVLVNGWPNGATYSSYNTYISIPVTGGSVANATTDFTNYMPMTSGPVPHSPNARVIALKQYLESLQADGVTLSPSDFTTNVEQYLDECADELQLNYGHEGEEGEEGSPFLEIYVNVNECGVYGNIQYFATVFGLEEGDDIDFTDVNFELMTSDMVFTDPTTQYFNDAWGV